MQQNKEANNELLAFLGIIADEDLQKGISVPSYVLCQDSESNPALVRCDRSNYETYSKILVNNLTDYDELITAMSNTRYFHRQKNERYFPEGVLCWFPCNVYGEQSKSEPPMVIKRVPDKSIPRDAITAKIQAGREAKNFIWRLTHFINQVEMLPIKKKKYTKEN